MRQFTMVFAFVMASAALVTAPVSAEQPSGPESVLIFYTGHPKNRLDECPKGEYHAELHPNGDSGRRALTALKEKKLTDDKEGFFKAGTAVIIYKYTTQSIIKKDCRYEKWNYVAARTQAEAVKQFEQKKADPPYGAVSPLQPVKGWAINP